jgi:uncharacterized sulfatase
MGAEESVCPGEAARRPNVVFVLCDDMAPWAFHAEHPNARTPNLDRLCAEGIRLSQYFSSSAVCSPARASLLTGMYNTEAGVPDILGRDDTGLETDKPSFAKEFVRGGYATALFGKWHLGHQDRQHPTRHGYQEFKGFRIGGIISKDPLVEIDGVEQRVEGYTSDILTDYTMEFIQRKTEEGQPFMVSVHYWAPHANQNVLTENDRTWHPLAEEDWKHFRDLDPVVPNPDYPKLDIPRIKRMTREYLASVHSVDRNVGRILDQLEKLGIDENTIVIFSSDNGFNLGHNGIWHKGNGWWILTDNRGDRPNLYDNSLRVPCIVRWPEHVSSGLVSHRVVNSMDWYPTLMQMCGLGVPSDSRVRGRNMFPILCGQPVDWDDDLFAQYSMWDWNQGGAQLRTYRTPEWKVVFDYKQIIQNELYHIVSDREEHCNRWNDPDPEVQRVKETLLGKMQTCMRKIKDPLIGE